MSESLRNDGRVWVPKTVETSEKLFVKADQSNQDIKDEDRDYFFRAKISKFWKPCTVMSPLEMRKQRDEGRGVNGI
jgi:succinate dehydrogenase / fumarate reductase flavoprotein subunit